MQFGDKARQQQSKPLRDAIHQQDGRDQQIIDALQLQLSYKYLTDSAHSTDIDINMKLHAFESTGVRVHTRQQGPIAAPQLVVHYKHCVWQIAVAVLHTDSLVVRSKNFTYSCGIRLRLLLKNGPYKRVAYAKAAHDRTAFLVSTSTHHIDSKNPRLLLCWKHLNS